MIDDLDEMIASARRRRDLALADARHAWDYERKAFPRWQEEARLAQSIVDVLDIVKGTPGMRQKTRREDILPAARELAVDLKSQGWPRYDA